MGQGSTLTITAKHVRAIFAVGDEWTADNTYSPRASGPRVLVEMRSTQLIWKTPQAERRGQGTPAGEGVY
jgi:hypothetical protein